MARNRSRKGIVSFLGAGATADAAYPVALAFNEQFLASLEHAKEREIEARHKIHSYIEKARSDPNILLPVGAERIDPANDPPILSDWFKSFWDRFAQVNSRIPILAVPRARADGLPDLPSVVLPGPAGSPVFTPYSARVERRPETGIVVQPAMEDFFAYYDNVMRPSIVFSDENATTIRGMQHNFRQLRRHALQVAYASLRPGEEHDGTYLDPLLDLAGPFGGPPCIATTNFDLAIEEVFGRRSITYNDGFNATPIASLVPPFPRESEALRGVREIWDDVTSCMSPFVGFDADERQQPKIIKLHGSLGWFALEEGSGEIGDREELRFNSTLEFFKCDLDIFFGGKSQVRGPANIVLDGQSPELWRKAGAFWLQPYMIYSRSLKTHPDRLAIALVHEFMKSLEHCETVMVVGYSWRDPHLNDVIFDEVARGAKLVNVSRDPLPENLVALVAQRFPTSFGDTASRIFTIGGGARSVLQIGRCTKPSGEVVKIDLTTLLKNDDVLREFSLRDNWALRAPARQ